jgi:hypothetical protein
MNSATVQRERVESQTPAHYLSRPHERKNGNDYDYDAVDVYCITAG